MRLLARTSCQPRLHSLGDLVQVPVLTAVRFTAVRTVLLEICRGWLPGSTLRRPRSSCVSAVLLPMVMKGEAVLLALPAGVGRLVMGSWTLARALLLQGTQTGPGVSVSGGAVVGRLVVPDCPLVDSTDVAGQGQMQVSMCWAVLCNGRAATPSPRRRCSSSREKGSGAGASPRCS